MGRVAGGQLDDHVPFQKADIQPQGAAPRAPSRDADTNKREVSSRLPFMIPSRGEVYRQSDKSAYP